jgi:hypothetical protein
MYSCGTVLLPRDGKLKEFTINPEDIEEVFQIELDGEKYRVKGDTYAELVTNLIRLRYTIDDELALSANIRTGKDVEQQEFEF